MCLSWPLSGLSEINYYMVVCAAGTSAHGLLYDYLVANGVKYHLFILI